MKTHSTNQLMNMSRDRLINEFRNLHREYLETNQELLQRREEVAELMAYKEKMEGTWFAQEKKMMETALHIKTGALKKLEHSLDLANDAIGRLQRLLEAGREEKAVLLQTIERTVDEQKTLPAIPQEVAEAIDYFRKLCNYKNHDFAYYLYKVVERDDNERTCAIKDYVHFNNNGNGDNLLVALVNGYTVEPLQPEDDQLKQRIQETYEEWLKLPPPENSDPQGEAAFLSEMIADRVREFYPESKS